jgi:hypothetical protein
VYRLGVFKSLKPTFRLGYWKFWLHNEKVLSTAIIAALKVLNRFILLLPQMA